MDTQLARTFLEIVATGSFVRAARRLNVAQTTVSARIRLLEQQLGRPLFVRNKSGASLTPAGEQLLRYAPTFVHLWQRVRHQVAVPEGHRSVLAIGSELALAQPLLLDWVLWMRRSLTDVALRVHVDVPQDLVSRVAEGLVDIAVMYAPPRLPGLKVDLLLDEKLVMVTTTPPGTPPHDQLVAVDWGETFARDFASSFPEDPGPALSVDLGPLALGYLLENGGTSYLRRQAVEPHLASGRLRLVPGMPQFSYPIYVVYPADLDTGIVEPALSGLRQVALGPAPQPADETASRSGARPRKSGSGRADAAGRV